MGHVEQAPATAAHHIESSVEPLSEAWSVPPSVPRDQLPTSVPDMRARAEADVHAIGVEPENHEAAVNALTRRMMRWRQIGRWARRGTSGAIATGEGEHWKVDHDSRVEKGIARLHEYRTGGLQRTVVTDRRAS